jgi:hypothetical protein
MRRLLVIAAVLTSTLVPAPATAAAPTPCKAADLRYPFQPGGPKTFGVLRLTIARAPAPPLVTSRRPGQGVRGERRRR